MPEFLRPWHGCLTHNHNHCPDCRVCDHWDDGRTA
jgi:hypothetical protein